ncbi:MAG: transposase [Ideonella sp.]
MLQYLSRYTHRTAIGNERIKAITADDEVVLSARRPESQLRPSWPTWRASRHTPAQAARGR